MIASGYITNTNKIQTFLFLTSLTAQQDSVIDMLLPMVDGAIVNYCGWNLKDTTYNNKTFDGTGTSQLDLQVYPITNLTSVIIADSGGTTTDVTADVKQKADEGIIYLTSSSLTLTTFTAGTRNVTVSFSGGYSTYPDDLVLAATLLGVSYFNRITQKNFGVKKERFNDVEAEYVDMGIPEDIQNMLNRYRNMYVR